MFSAQFPVPLDCSVGVFFQKVAVEVCTNLDVVC